MNYAEKAAAIVGITQLLKYYGLPSKFCPLAAVVISVLFVYHENPTSDGIIEGVALGATVTGSYGIVKNSANGVLGKVGGNTVSENDVPMVSLGHDED
jgi:hypothetical protein